MARRRKGFLDLVEVNQTLARVQTTLPSLLDDLQEETEDFMEFESLIVSLHTFSMWLRRVRVLTTEALAPARLHLSSLANEIISSLKLAEARSLSPRLRASLASLGKLALTLSRRP